MKPHGILAQAAERLSMTDGEIARELGLSVAALRTVTGLTSDAERGAHHVISIR